MNAPRGSRTHIHGFGRAELYPLSYRGILARHARGVASALIIALLPIFSFAQDQLTQNQPEFVSEKENILSDSIKAQNVRREIRELQKGRPTISSFITSSGSWTFTTNGRGIVWADGSVTTSAYVLNGNLDPSSVTLQGNLYNLVNISSSTGLLVSGFPYFAACDGTTNDATDLQACINDSATHGIPCVLPNRTCASSSALTLTQGASLIGMGAIADHSSTDATLLMNTNGGGTTCSLNSGGAIVVQIGNSVTILKNLNIESGHAQTKCLINASGTGAGSSNQVGNFNMEKVNLTPHASSTDTIALVIGNNVRLRVINNYFAPGFRNSVKDLGTFTIASTIDLNTFDGPGVSSTSYKVILSGSSGLGEGIAGISVNGNIFQPDPRALQVAGAYGASITDNWFGDVDVDADGAYMIDLDGVAINLKHNAINANDRNSGHLHAIKANGDSINITGNWIDAAWDAITLVGDGHIVEGNDIFTPERAGIAISSGTSMKVGPNNIQIGGGGRKPIYCDPNAAGNYIYHTLENETGLSTCNSSNIVHNSSVNYSSQLGYDYMAVDEEFYVGNTTFAAKTNGRIGIGTSSPSHPVHIVLSSTTGHQKGIRLEGAGGSVTGSLGIKTTYGGAGACYDLALNNLNAGDFEYGTYGDMNVRNCTDTNAGAYGNINFITNGYSRMSIGGGTEQGIIYIGSGTAPSSKWDVAGGFYGINHLTPSSALHVNGSGIISSTFTIQGDDFSVVRSTFYVDSGKVGIGTSAPSMPLEVYSAGVGNIMTLSGEPGVGRLYFQKKTNGVALYGYIAPTTTGKLYLGGGGTDTIEVSASSSTFHSGVSIDGKLGIGTTPESSATKLQVAGAAANMITYLTNTTNTGINYLVFNESVGAGATPAALSRYGSAHANAGRFEMMTFEAAPITLGTNSTVRVTVPSSGYSIETSSGIKVGAGKIDLTATGSFLAWPDGSISTSAFSSPGSGAMNVNNADGGATTNQGVFVYAKSVDGATQSSGCVVAVQMPSQSSSAIMQFTSTSTAGFDFSTNQARPGVLLESCSPTSICKVGVKGVYRITSSATFNTSLPAMSSTRCQVQGSGTMGTNAIGWGVTSGGFTAGAGGWVMLQ